MNEVRQNGNGAQPAIVVRDLKRRFGQQQVLNGVNIDLPTGEITTIVGPSGCGKTVFLKHLNLLLRPDSGSIVIDGADVTKLGTRGLDGVREKFGMLFQAGALFDSMSVFDNVAFPLVEKTALSRSEIRDRVLEVLKQVGLEGMERKFPSEMSGGMQKRAALARALVRRPKILMLDEPTTGLDPTRTHSIHALVRETQSKFDLTAIMVSHDVPQVFEFSDRVAYMHLGKIELFGTVKEVMASDNPNFRQFLAGRSTDEEERPLSQVIATPGR
ncbi:MAG TPA: ATP-binding cassette domain-containing protein [Candidatus Binataceae bacterium]|nr:ATP-binding cassette domain-containing protein [Candidatus Binataceae bacterium]